MLHIVGAGFAYPSQRLDNEFLRSLDGGAEAARVAEALGIRARHTSVPLQHLRDSKNADPLATFRCALERPTDLGFQAARMACERAGIAPVDLNLIVGESLTPAEVTPSEAQRIGCKLGLKIPCYDLITNCLPAYLSILSSWRTDRLPDYSLCVSTHALTQRIDYSKGTERAIFGDGAYAIVVSKSRREGLAVKAAHFRTKAANPDTIAIDTMGHLHAAVLDGTRVTEQVRDTFAALDPSGTLRGTEIDLIWECTDRSVREAALNATGFNRVTSHSILSERGDIAGVTAGAALAEAWDRYKPGRNVVLLHADGSGAWGGVWLVRE